MRVDNRHLTTANFIAPRVTYDENGVRIVKTVEVTQTGFMQTICLPEDCHIEGSEVFVKRIGRSILLIPRDVDPWQLFTESLAQFTDDYMQDRGQPTNQEQRLELE